MWKKKFNNHKGRNYYYSLRNKLKKEKKISNEIEVAISNLTLEELIGLKLELSSAYVNDKLYNFPIWRSMYYICREACLMYSLSACRTMKDSASLMGITESDFRKEVKKYNINVEEQHYG